MAGVLLTGVNSAIVKALLPLIPNEHVPYQLRRAECDLSNPKEVAANAHIFKSTDFIVLAHGKLTSDNVLSEAMPVNLYSFIIICETALQNNPRARIVVLGSESATKGSRDVGYWMAKAGLHSYVRGRKLQHPGQQLVCVAPSMVMGTGMTAQKSPEQVAAAIASHPKQRGLEPIEVAKLIHFLLFVDQGYITNTIVEINGGKFAGSGVQ